MLNSWKGPDLWILGAMGIVLGFIAYPRTIGWIALLIAVFFVILNIHYHAKGVTFFLCLCFYGVIVIGPALIVSNWIH